MGPLCTGEKRKNDAAFVFTHAGTVKGIRSDLWGSLEERRRRTKSSQGLVGGDFLTVSSALEVREIIVLPLQSHVHGDHGAVLPVGLEVDVPWHRAPRQPPKSRGSGWLQSCKPPLRPQKPSLP